MRWRRADAAGALRRGASFGSRALDLSVALSVKEARRRRRMFRQKAFFILQCAIAAGVAYALARDVFDVAVPLFAPVSAMICLGMTYGQRLRRAVEITVGVAVGVFVGELFVLWFGMGPWQVVAIVAVAMGIASTLGGGGLIVTQAGVQGLIVALLAAQPQSAFGRWVEALIGCFVALVFATVVPTSTLLRPRGQATAILHNLSDLMSRVAIALDDRDADAALGTLDDARRTEADLTALRGYAGDSVEIIRLAPVSRSMREQVAAVAAFIEPMDRAVRNARVLFRRATISLQTGEEVPGVYAEWVEQLADATEVLVYYVAGDGEPPALRPTLARLAATTAAPHPEASLSAEVIRAQIRSILVDYLMMLGDPLDAAQRAVREASAGPGPAP